MKDASNGSTNTYVTDKAPSVAGRPRLNRAKLTRNASGLNERGWATEMPEVRLRETNSAAIGVGVGRRSGDRIVERGRWMVIEARDAEKEEKKKRKKICSAVLIQTKYCSLIGIVLRNNLVTFDVPNLCINYQMFDLMLLNLILNTKLWLLKFIKKMMLPNKIKSRHNEEINSRVTV